MQRGTCDGGGSEEKREEHEEEEQFRRVTVTVELDTLYLPGIEHLQEDLGCTFSDAFNVLAHRGFYFLWRTGGVL